MHLLVKENYLIFDVTDKKLIIVYFLFGKLIRLKQEKYLSTSK